MNSWIDVNEATPAEDGWYLVWAPRYHGGSSTGREHYEGGYMFAKYRKNHKIPWSIDTRNYSGKSEVEYWMPLPDKPGSGNRKISEDVKDIFADDYFIASNSLNNIMTNIKQKEDGSASISSLDVKLLGQAKAHLDALYEDIKMCFGEQTLS